MQGRMRVDALHLDAALAGLVVRAEHHSFDDVVEFFLLVRIDDAGGIAAEFEHDFLAPGLRFQLPADLAAGEREQLEALVADEGSGILDTAGQDRERALGQIGFGEDFADDERADRCLPRRLQNEWTTRRDRRCDLVRDQVEREVERRDERAGADRHALHEAAITLRALRDLEVQHLAIDAHRLLGGGAERVDQARDFALGVLDRLARFDAQREREFVEAFAETRDAVFKHGLAREWRERAHRRLRVDRGDDRLVDRPCIGKRHVRGDLAGVLVEDREGGIRLTRLVGEVVRVGRFRHGGPCLRRFR